MEKTTFSWILFFILCFSLVFGLAFKDIEQLQEKIHELETKQNQLLLMAHETYPKETITTYMDIGFEAKMQKVE